MTQNRDSEPAQYTALLIAIGLLVAGCGSTTMTDVVRRDTQERKTCGQVTYVGHVVETCDLVVGAWPWSRARWTNCRVTTTHPLGFSATEVVDE